ncbi:hypothetical protein HYW21_06640 [Candidatus Woesearchaeota archaeon]|nr:hypothetical protein [Candidatus Woesearchaeota archaeon]
MLQLDIPIKFHEVLRNQDKYVVAILLDPLTYQEMDFSILRYFLNEEKIPGLYVTVNKPFATLHQALERENLDLNKVLFIDAITETHVKGKEDEDCVFIGSPTNLSDLSFAMNEAINAIPFADKFLIFDSIPTLLVYNKRSTVERFVHFLTQRARQWNVRCVLYSVVMEGEQDLTTLLSQFCDAIIDLRGDQR